MTKAELIEKEIDTKNGYLIIAEAVSQGVSRTYLSNYIKEHNMEKVAQGIYILDDVWPDDLFILQSRNTCIVYSGETALYLHGLTDREYSKICFSVPVGANVSHITIESKEIKYFNTDIYNLGIGEVVSSSGNLVRAYNKERCICDLIKNRSEYEVQLFQTAIKEYMTSRKKNISRLIEYANTLGIRDEVMKYVEVMT